jgi:hypothetical protein
VGFVVKFNWFKISYGFLIALMALLLVHYAVQVASGGHAWKTGDWLINYSDGLIRRGLSGAVSIFVAQILSVDVKWITFLIQVVFFVTFVCLTLKEFYQFKNNQKSILLLLSPAFAFMFWINDPAVAFRKEICIYLALIFVLKAFQKNEVRLVWYFASLALFLFAGLSHEITVFFIPFFCFAIFNHYGTSRSNVKLIIKYAAPFLIASLGILLVSLLYRGSQHSMDAICSSLQPYALKEDICEGAISWLKYDTRHGFERVLELGWTVWLNYLLLAALSILPLLCLKADKYFLLLIVAGGISMFPLFFIAVDYGRFISMSYTAAVLSCVWTRPWLVQNTWPIQGVIGFLYVFFWAIPNCCKNTPGKGLLGDALSSAIGF